MGALISYMLGAGLSEATCNQGDMVYKEIKAPYVMRK
jgi:hypothetical protein